MAFPEQPIFNTQVHTFAGFDENPGGQTVKMAIMDWYGNNREDSVVISKLAVDLGKFTMVITKSHTLMLRPDKMETNVEYKFGKPPGVLLDKKFEKFKFLFDNLDENGLAIVGSKINYYPKLRRGDVIIGRYAVIKNSKGRIIKYSDASLYAGHNHNGIVDRAFLSTNVNKDDNIATVRIRKIRAPEVGDKFASRSAQKSVISMIANTADLPFTESGMIADIYMNPLAIPTRMTINQMIEMIASKHGVLTGQRVDASGFRKYDFKGYASTLVRYGYNKSGKEKFFDGITGEEIDGLIYVGPCYYQALKHHVSDKIQYRSIGNLDPTTRQAPGGKETGGGLRLGEMEQAALAAYGAENILQERMCTSSSEYHATFCLLCSDIVGVEKTRTGRQPVCGACNKLKPELKPKFGKCKIPFTFKTLTDTMAAAGIKIKLNFKLKRKR